MRQAVRDGAWLAFFLALMFLGQWRIQQSFRWPYTPLNELKASENFAGDLGALFLGAHRLAADIAYIQFLQYYGVSEHDDVHEGKDHPGGIFPGLKDRATRYMRLDPYFNGAILEAAGALAFNVERTNQALEYLAEAISRDPTYYRYHLYVAAILFRERGQEQQLIAKLEEAVKFDDCPPLLQGVLGNLLKKYGRYEDAARVYLHTYETAAAPGEKNLALERLKKLLIERPELQRKIGL